jgi:hypothetical protein
VNDDYKEITIVLPKPPSLNQFYAGRHYSVRTKHKAEYCMTSSIWNDIRLTCALIVATMLTMLYVVVNFLLIILETMAMLMMTLRNTLRSNQQSTTKT